MSPLSYVVFIFFFFNDTATTEIYTLSLHDALPISLTTVDIASRQTSFRGRRQFVILLKGSFLHHHEWVSIKLPFRRDRKSTRLNSSHVRISYAVFCLKKKKKKHTIACIQPIQCRVH